MRAPGSNVTLAPATLPTGWRAIRLTGPVRPGDTLRAESRIDSVGTAGIEGVGLVTRTITGIDQAGAAVVRIEEVDRAVARRSPGMHSIRALEGPGNADTAPVG